MKRYIFILFIPLFIIVLCGANQRQRRDEVPAPPRRQSARRDTVQSRLTVITAIMSIMSTPEHAVTGLPQAHLPCFVKIVGHRGGPESLKRGLAKNKPWPGAPAYGLFGSHDCDACTAEATAAKLELLARWNHQKPFNIGFFLSFFF